MKNYDVMVIGSGFAGMAAALFAAERGLSVAQTGATGGIDFSTGFIDLLAVHPIAEQKVWEDPFAALAALRRDLPDHPYCRVSDDEICRALEQFTTFLGHHGLCYRGRAGKNTLTLTAAGTMKPTYLLPCTAWNGVKAWEMKAPTLLVDFSGLKGLSARQIAEVRKDSWPNLKVARIKFPGMGGELYPEHMAWSMADPARRAELAQNVAPHIADAKYVGFPAVLGMTDTAAVLSHLEELLDRPVFEIPTLPPSIAGPRLRAAFDRGLPGLGVRTYTQKLITKAACSEEGFSFTAGSGSTSVDIFAKSAILASGRFFGKGLRSDRHRIFEAVFDLPVSQPKNRSLWHRPDFFDPNGHEVNQAGIETDANLRPLDAQGRVFHPRLHAAGAILAHQDWMRMKCGAGLAIATAYKAVASL
ncbi:MAG: glycerol-3-phosphate dehydrogenase subunit GlpB [Desulfomicrobium apsheronum]|nr:glycerol-3-phosphate dehydrogenase subunit GlpB [Desulfomicrobium apsheronum]